MHVKFCHHDDIIKTVHIFSYENIKVFLKEPAICPKLPAVSRARDPMCLGLPNGFGGPRSNVSILAQWVSTDRFWTDHIIQLLIVFLNVLLKTQGKLIDSNPFKNIQWRMWF